MATIANLVRQLATPPAATASDADLLARFVQHGDTNAFEAILRRHGGMVQGVCVRVLGRTVEAEDAYQATFLVLLRRAGSLEKPEQLGPWLYGVAYRCACKARRLARRRPLGALDENVTTCNPATTSLERLELARVLDEEIRRLPSRYQAPLVLCLIQRHTHEEAGRILRCPRETVTTRLARARARLQKRLLGRGIAPALAATLEVVVDEDAARAASLCPRTFELVTDPGHTTGLTVSLTPTVVQLGEGVMRSMWLSKQVGRAVVLVVVVALLGLGGMLALAQQPRQQQQRGSAEEKIDTTLLAQGPTQSFAKQNPSAHSVKNGAPVVVQTVPQAGDTQVDAATTKEIRVKFSKDMKDGAWSWSQISKEHYPQTTGKPHFEKDQRTCVLPVKLEPGKTYVIWLNPEKFQGFRDMDGKPSVFYPLIFETKP